MTLPVKSLIGLISSNSSRRPLSMNQANESSWSSMRFGIGRTSGIRAYRLREDGIERVDESAADSMNYRSLTEEKGKVGGRAHRRSRIPRFSHMSNGTAAEATARRQPVSLRELVTRSCLSDSGLGARVVQPEGAREHRSERTERP